MEGIDITVLSSGNLLRAQGLARFTILSTGKHYLIYSFGEKSPQNNVEYNRVYVAETGENASNLADITQDEWDMIKTDIMSDLCKPNATIPSSIQLSKLQPTQYVVGNYKKIALTEDYYNNMIANQKNNEPQEDTIAPTGNTQFFDQSVIQTNEVIEEEKDEPAVPNAFGMSASQEDIAPTTLVEEEAPQVIIKNEELNPEAIKQEVINALIKVINYCDGDMNKFNELLNSSGALTEESTIVETPKTIEEIHNEFPEPQTSVIDINNIPVVNQEPVAEENVLHEESFEPTVPTVPVDTMTSIPVVTEELINGTTENVQTIEMPQMVQPEIEVPQQIEPVQVEMPQEVVQPTVDATTIVETPIIEQQPQTITQEVVDTPQMATPEVITQVVEPMETPQAIEQPQFIEQPVQSNETNTIEQPVQAVEAPIIEQPVIEPVVPTQTIEQPIIAQPIETPNTLGGPTIIGVNDNTQQDLSFIDAGPVVMPSGQENVQSHGLPGDNGAKVLEKVA